MKRYNFKQLAWSRNKALKAGMQYLLNLFVFVFAVFAVITFAQVIVGNLSASAPIILSGIPIILFTMADIGNIDQPNDRDTAANQIGFRLYLLERSQIDDSVSFPIPNANRELGNITLNAGQYWHHFDGIDNSLKYTGTAEKGDVTSTFGKTIPVMIKYSVASLNFVEEMQGKGFVLAWQICETASKEIVGSLCKPVYLKKSDVKEDSDGKYISLEFGNDHWRQPLTYVGSITEQAPVTLGTGVTELAYESGNDAYQLTAGLAAFATVSGIGSADYGKHLTVLAPASGVAPTIPDSGVFVLKDAATWTANPGSSITFQILDDATLVEVSRIQTGA